MVGGCGDSCGAAVEVEYYPFLITLLGPPGGVVRPFEGGLASESPIIILRLGLMSKLSYWTCTGLRLHMSLTVVDVSSHSLLIVLDIRLRVEFGHLFLKTGVLTKIFIPFFLFALLELMLPQFLLLLFELELFSLHIEVLLLQIEVLNISIELFPFLMHVQFLVMKSPLVFLQFPFLLDKLFGSRLQLNSGFLPCRS